MPKLKWESQNPARKCKNMWKRGSPIPLPMLKPKCQVDDQVRKMQKTGVSEVATIFPPMPKLKQESQNSPRKCKKQA